MNSDVRCMIFFSKKSEQIIFRKTPDTPLTTKLLLRKR